MPNPKKKRGAGILPCVPCVVVLHFGGGVVVVFWHKYSVLFFSTAMLVQQQLCLFKTNTATTHNMYYVYLCDGYLYGYHIYFLLNILLFNCYFLFYSFI